MPVAARSKAQVPHLLLIRIIRHFYFNKFVLGCQKAKHFKRAIPLIREEKKIKKEHEMKKVFMSLVGCVLRVGCQSLEIIQQKEEQSMSKALDQLQS